VAVRHTAVAVAPGICYGAQDVPLAADWHPAVASAATEALAAAVRAAERAPAGTGLPTGTSPRVEQQSPRILLWSSHATRCRTLARHISEQMETPVRVDARLAEMDFGEWEGQRWDDIERDPRYAQWSANWQTESTPGESLPAVVARVRAVLAEIATDTASPADSATPRPVPLIVTHLGVIRACNHIYRSTALSDFLDCTVEPGGVIAWERL
jgi:alpha-ribazole phosphatase